MTEKWLVGVDVGGTTVKMAFFTQTGEMIAKWEIDTVTKENGKHIPRDISDSIQRKLEELKQLKDNVIGIGIGAPGPVNFENGAIEVAVNLGWEDFPLKEMLEKESGLPVVVDNDANLAALGEMWTGAGEGANDLIFVTLGTGVGGGVIVNGKIVHGKNGAGGEIGHVTSVIEGGAACNCGKNGCLETIASATGIVRLANEQLQTKQVESSMRDYYLEHNTVTAKLVLDAFKENDPIAKQVIEYVSLHLGLALANLANGLNPEKVVIGGGVSRAGIALLEPIQEQFSRFAFPKVLEAAELTIASLGNDAGVVGGAWLAKTKLG
ncbi:glucokinase [Halalkalibacter wakoensis JCM 9140]|uniref:Glucokinase n=1 Tax=Halalkalibacter wakoensis JCM 9140 TaxID=1236970 RepID=W4PZY2_9BACI|nr:ROK family glucokinase [Halalkalibacter wakoensis]GAE24679.1 glucokinase [Halalkalibacter wakoensis JCM 9140]